MNKEIRNTEQEAIYIAAEMLGKTFIQRKDMFASQLEDGRYVAVREPLTPQHLVYHLEGKVTLGAYVLDQDNQARYIVFDSDKEAGLKELADLSLALRERNVPSYLETSRRGGHLWMFFDRPLPGETAKAFGKGIIACHKVNEVELFPKQAWLDDGPGSLIRLPFGIHLRTGKRYPFLKQDGELLAPTVREQIAMLSQGETVPIDLIDEFTSLAPVEPVKVYESNGDEIWEKIKNKTTVMDFIGAFVPLKKTGYGAIGKCPFHSDDRPSLGINAKDNYWNCFAGCGSGSVIDFWMKLKNVDFPEAVKELADLLGVEK